MSVVGIDLGTQFSKVAVAFRKKISMVPNEQSKFETTTLVGYTEKQREIGEAAETTLSRNYANTVSQVKRYLGRHWDDPTLTEELNRWNYCKVNKSEDNGIAFEVNTSEGPKELSSEQVLCAFLRQLKEFTVKYLEGLQVKDCVITCPSYFTDAQRRSIIAAANLAELNVLRLLNETTATAVSYGLFRKLEENRRVMFVDMGYSNTQVCVVDFGPSQLEMYATSSDAFLGARDFDFALFEHFRKQIEEKHHVNILTNARAKLRLMKGVERVKKLLTGNRDAVFLLECLINDIDFTLRITREEFDALCAPLLKQLSECVKNVIAEMRARDEIKYSNKNTNVNKTEDTANASATTTTTTANTNTNTTTTTATATATANPTKPPVIHSVEIIGGASRIRCVQEGLIGILKQHIPEAGIDKCCTTLNGDECVARGAALMCAMLSPNFKVREFQVKDMNNWPVMVSYPSSALSLSSENKTNTNGDNLIRQVVLKRHAPCPCTAKMTFYTKEPFSVMLEHPKDEVKMSENETLKVEYPLKSNLEIGKFEVDIPPLSENSVKDPQIKLTLSLNKHGLLEPPQGELIEFVKREEPKTEAETKPEPMNVDKPATDNAATSEKASGENKPQENSAENNKEKKNENNPNGDQEMTDKSKPTEPTTEANKDGKTDAAPAAAPKKKSDKKKIVRTLSITGKFFSQVLNQKMKDWMDLEGKLDNIDRIVRETNDRRNELETYVYDMRSKLERTHKNFMSDAQKEEFLTQLDGVEQWLYEEGDHANKTAYAEKMQALKRTGDPMLSKFWEAEQRPNRFANLKKLTTNYQQFVDSTDEKYAHIGTEDREAVRKMIVDADEWMVGKMLQQDKLQPYETPAVMCSEIDNKYRELLSKCQPIVTKPKPEPPKPEPAKESAENKPKDAAAESEKDKSKETPSAEHNPKDEQMVDIKHHTVEEHNESLVEEESHQETKPTEEEPQD